MAPSRKQALVLLARTVGVACTAYAASNIAKFVSAARESKQSQEHLCAERPDPNEGLHGHVLGGRYVKNSRGLYLLRRCWKAEKPNGHLVVLMHGFGEHVGRYEHVAAALCAAGFEVHGMDQQGHGGSEGDRAFFDSFSDIVEDNLQLVRDASGPSGRKVMAIGHSLGGCILTMCVLKAPELFKAVVLSGPGIWVKKDDSQPQWPLKVFRQVALRVPKLCFPAIDVKKICRTEAVVRSYQLDPLVHHGGFPLGTMREMLASIQYIMENADSFSTPLLLQHGTKDELVPVAASEWMIDAAASTTKSLLTYEGWRHEVYNECEDDCGVERDPATGVTSNRALRDAVTWLSVRAAEK